MMGGLVEWAMAAQPADGETDCGDGGMVRERDGCALAAAVDGLGHGPEAADAARVALGVLAADPANTVAETALRCHEALEGTRGAAISLASFDAARDEMTWLGIGNVQGRIVRTGAARGDSESLLLRPGIAGEDFPSHPPTATNVSRGDLLVLATDGVESSFDRDLTADGSCRDIAGALLGKHARGADDALVLVVRYLGARG